MCTVLFNCRAPKYAPRVDRTVAEVEDETRLDNRAPSPFSCLSLDMLVACETLARSSPCNRARPHRQRVARLRAAPDSSSDSLAITGLPGADALCDAFVCNSSPQAEVTLRQVSPRKTGFRDELTRRHCPGRTRPGQRARRGLAYAISVLRVGAVRGSCAPSERRGGAQTI